MRLPCLWFCIVGVSSLRFPRFLYRVTRWLTRGRWIGSLPLHASVRCVFSFWYINIRYFLLLLPSIITSLFSSIDFCFCLFIFFFLRSSSPLRSFFCLPSFCFCNDVFKFVFLSFCSCFILFCFFSVIRGEHPSDLWRAWLPRSSPLTCVSGSRGRYGFASERLHDGLFVEFPRRLLR